jgi:hypothetical protein
MESISVGNTKNIDNWDWSQFSGSLLRFVEPTVEPPIEETETTMTGDIDIDTEPDYEANWTTTPSAEGTTISAEETTTPSAEGTTTSSAEGATTPSAEGTTTPSVEETTTSSAEETTTPSAEGTTTPSAEGTTTPSAEGTTTSTEETTTPSAEGTTTSSAEGKTTPSNDGTTTPTPVTSTTTSDRPISTSTKPLICNYDGEYNEIQGVNWPPVSPGEFSVVNCTKGNGIMKWKCLSDGKFDGEVPDVSGCWINDILDKIDNITQIKEVQEVLDTIINGTEINSSLSSSDGLKDVVTIVEKLKDKLNLTEVDLDVATNLTTQFIKVFNNLIDQNNAWDDSTQTEKTDISSKILINIQFTSFILSCSLNQTKQKEIIFTQNIIIETYFSNFEERINFEANKSSITIPSGLNLNIERECRNSSVASLINKLDNYLLGGIVESQIMNSKIIAFSLTKDNKTTQINDGLKVRMR